MSFRENPIRMLSIMREAGEHGQELNADILSEIKKDSVFLEINQHNREIIRDEITRILLSDFEMFIKIAEADYDAQSDLKLQEKGPQMQRIKDFAACIMKK